MYEDLHLDLGRLFIPTMRLLFGVLLMQSVMMT
jgi:hypothetical protein